MLGHQNLLLVTLHNAFARCRVKQLVGRAGFERSVTVPSAGGGVLGTLAPDGRVLAPRTAAPVGLLTPSLRVLNARGAYVGAAPPPPSAAQDNEIDDIAASYSGGRSGEDVDSDEVALADTVASGASEEMIEEDALSGGRSLSALATLSLRRSMRPVRTSQAARLLACSAAHCGMCA